MGRQINYYMEHESFLQAAQLALDCGCEIVKQDLDIRPTKVIRTRNISAITPGDWMFWFYVPEAGRLVIKTDESGERVEHGYLRESGSVLIEAGVSFIDEEKKTISRSRLYIQSGHYDENNVWIPRLKCVDDIYNKLVRRVKKLTTYDGFNYRTEYCARLLDEGYNTH